MTQEKKEISEERIREIVREEIEKGKAREIEEDEALTQKLKGNIYVE